MASHICMQIFLLSLAIVLFHSSLVFQNADAYKTYQLVKYCRRTSSKNKPEMIRDEIDRNLKQLENQIGLIIPELSGHKFLKDDDNRKAHDDDDYGSDGAINVDELKAAKSITVEDGSDESAIRIVISNKYKHSYRNWQHCSLFVRAKKPNGLIVTIRKLHLRSGVDWLRLSINNGTFVREFSHVKIDDERDSVAYVAHHGVLIEFDTGYSIKPTDTSQLELTLTSFREADLCHIDDEYDCGSFRCISNAFQCDGVNNCGDARDETGCPMDNITNYLIISSTLLLVSFLVFLCFCYRCCCRKRRQPYRKQYQYVKIRTSSLAGGAVGPNGNAKRRSSSIHSEADVVNTNLRRIKMTHFGDSMPVLVPSAPPRPPNDSDYGTTGNTYLHLPYQPYAIQLGPSGSSIGLIPASTLYAQPSTSRHQNVQEHHTFPLPQPTYPMLHSQLFTPPAPTPPPPPYSPRDENR